MADAAEKAKAEKIAAARKRVEQLKKKSTAKKSDAKKDAKPEASEASMADEKPEEKAAEQDAGVGVEADEDASKEVEIDGAKDAEETVADLSKVPRQRGHSSSISQQSKMRSSSFRASSGPLSPSEFPPEENTAPDIYRKQAIRIEELEKENRRLAKEASDGERRWKKAEEELEELREIEGDSSSKAKDTSSTAVSSGQLEKLQAEIAALQRQNSQLQSQASRTSRHGSSPSMSLTVPPELEAALQSKNSTIESMEIEISNLRAQLDRVASGSSVEKEQIAALEEKLARSERSAATAQHELTDLKKNLERTTEKAVKEGSERTSAETKLRTLGREAEEAKAHSDGLQKKVDSLEKKVATLATLHKEHDARFQAQRREREKAEKDAADVRLKLASTENENLRLQEERDRLKKRDAEGIDDDGVDELENEERQRLEKKVRDLEAEVHELRSGIWRERRKELGSGEHGVTSPGSKFTDVDLGGGLSPNGRKGAQGKGIGDFFTSGFNAITGAAPAGNDDGLLDDDGGLDFDEDAFRRAHEEEAKQRIERIKEVKRGLKDWEGWRLDLVDNRRGGGEGVGEIFEI